MEVLGSGAARILFLTVITSDFARFETTFRRMLGQGCELSHVDASEWNKEDASCFKNDNEQILSISSQHTCFFREFLGVSWYGFCCVCLLRQNGVEVRGFPFLVAILAV